MKKLITTSRITLIGVLLLMGIVSSCSKDSPSATVPAAGAGEVAAALSADGRVSLAANKVTRQTALKELARAAGFELVTKPVDKTEETSVRLEGVPVSEAVEKLAAGQPYFLTYKFDAAQSRHVLETVAVGEHQDARSIHLKRRRERRAFIERKKKELLKEQRERERGAKGEPPIPSAAETPVSSAPEAPVPPAPEAPVPPAAEAPASSAPEAPTAPPS